MKNSIKVLGYIGIIILVVLLSVGISVFSNFYNNLNYVGLDKVLFQDIVAVIFVVFVLLIIPFILFFVRTKIINFFYSKRLELPKNLSTIMTVLDVVFSILLFGYILTNLKEIYFSIVLPTSFSEMFNIYDYPFIIKVSKFLVIYFCVIWIYFVIPIFYLAHKSYLIRFVSLNIFPHSVSIFLSLLLFITFTLVSLTILVYSFLLSIELSQNYSLIFTLGIIVSLITLIYSVNLLISLLKNSSIPWYSNIIVVLFIVLFIVVASLSNKLPSVSLLKLNIIDEIKQKQNNSRFVFKVNKVNVSNLFDKIDISKLENLKEIKIEEYKLPTANEAVLRIIRKSKLLERLYIFISSGSIDSFFKRNLIITNYIDVEKLVNYLLPMSFYFSSISDNTNYFEFSFPYDFGGQIFFYKRYLLSWELDGKVNVYDVRNTNMNTLKKDMLSSKDYYLLKKNLKVSKKSGKLFYVISTNQEYFALSTRSNCVLLSNENYTYIFVNDYTENETFLFLEGVPLFLSNITFDNKDVGMKVRYFDIDGRGGNIQEAISNLIGNASYYYKVIELTNKIERLKEYIESNKDEIPTDVLEKLRSIISK